MSIVTLAEVKRHLNVEHDADDELLTQLTETAEAYTLQYIGADAYPDPMPSTLKLAILMLVGFWYSVRESAVMGGNVYTVPFGFSDLVQSHRRWVF